MSEGGIVGRREGAREGGRKLREGEGGRKGKERREGGKKIISWVCRETLSLNTFVHIPQ